MASTTVMLPAPPNAMFLLAPVMALPVPTSMVSVPASLLMRLSLFNVMALVTVLFPDKLRNAPFATVLSTTPVPLSTKGSAMLISPCSANVAPEVTEVPLAALPKALLCAATSVPSVTVVEPE